MRRTRSREKSYMQPEEATWREFIEYRRWTPAELDELPDDWLLSEWLRYGLMTRYGIPLPGRG